jgi:membrane-associated phospholipid phosphatase
MNHISSPDEPVLAPELLLGWGLTVILGSAILLIVGGGQGGFLAIQSFGQSFPSGLWSSLTALADERMLLALMLPFGLRFPKTFWAAIVSSLLASAAVHLIKSAIPMLRPAEVLGAAEITLIGPARTGYSFPSSHAATVFAVAGVWATRLGWRMALPVLAVATLAGMAQIAIGANWPIDVLAGVVIGLVCAWLGLAMLPLLRCGMRPAVHWTLAGSAAVAIASLPFNAQGDPEAIAFRYLLCIVGLIGFWRHYLAPLCRDGWASCRKLPQS